MRDELVLLLVIVVLYLGECLLWLPRNGALFSRWIGQWRAKFAGGTLGNQHGAVSMAHPLPPLGLAIRSEPFPCSFSPEGILSFNSAAFSGFGRKPQTSIYLPWEEIKSVQVEGKKLFLNDRLFLKTNSSSRATDVAALANNLRKMGMGQRETAIRQVAKETLSAARVLERKSLFDQQKRPLQILGNVLFAFLFAGVPLIVWQLGLVRMIWWILGLMLLQTITLAVLFWRAHKRLYPGGTDERLTPFLSMLLAPPSAIRAADFLGRNLFEEFHPVAVGASLLEKEEFHRLLRKVLRDLQFPLLPLPSALTAEGKCEEWFRQMLQAEVERTFPECKAELVAVRRSPAKADPGNHLYCPRCLQQFTASAECCQDCGGRPLLPLA